MAASAGTLRQAGERVRHSAPWAAGCAGQVAGNVVAIGHPRPGEVAEFIAMRMDRYGDVLLFAPHALHLLAPTSLTCHAFPAIGICSGCHRVVLRNGLTTFLTNW